MKEFPAAESQSENGGDSNFDFSVEDVRDVLEDFRSLKVLVVGDTIFDRYSTVNVQGLTSKNMIISGRFLTEETQCGGALAVFRHVKQFVDQVRFVSLVGTESWAQALIQEHVPEPADGIVRESGFTTIVKQRYVQPLSTGKELGKLFAVNYIDDQPPAVEMQDRILDAIRAEMGWSDIVLLLDFGHGMMQPKLRQALQTEAPFLALNCQTNSNNHGYNIISRQYSHADAFSLDEQELMLSAGHRHLNFSLELNRLRESLRSRYAWLTRGAIETVGQREGPEQCVIPSLENKVVDSVGAGDAFFSVAALASVRRLPIGMATLLGQLAGAQAVKIVGNARPISKDRLLRAAARWLQKSQKDRSSV